METATDHHHSHHHRVQFSEEIAMAARLFIAMIRSANYDDPIDFETLDSEWERWSEEEAAATSSGELVGTKRRSNGSASAAKKKSRKTTRKPMKRSPVANGKWVAAHVKLAELGSYEWVMAQVAGYSPDSKLYTVVDLETDDDAPKDQRRTKYKVGRKDLRLISDENPSRSRSKNSKVLARYPDTSVFYPAVVRSSSKKKGGAIVYRLEFEGEEEPGEAVEVTAKYVLDLESR